MSEKFKLLREKLGKIGIPQFEYDEFVRDVADQIQIKSSSNKDYLKALHESNNKSNENHGVSMRRIDNCDGDIKLINAEQIRIRNEQNQMENNMKIMEAEQKIMRDKLESLKLEMINKFACQKLKDDVRVISRAVTANNKK